MSTGLKTTPTTTTSDGIDFTQTLAPIIKNTLPKLPLRVNEMIIHNSIAHPYLKDEKPRGIAVKKITFR